MRVRHRSLEEEPDDGREHEENRDNDGRIEQELLSATALVEGRCEIVASKGSTQGRPSVLKDNTRDEE